jgi:hypothetical protein
MKALDAKTKAPANDVSEQLKQDYEKQFGEPWYPGAERFVAPSDPYPFASAPQPVRDSRRAPRLRQRR